jgi:hypothetical protein
MNDIESGPDVSSGAPDNGDESSRRGRPPEGPRGSEESAVTADAPTTSAYPPPTALQPPGRHRIPGRTIDPAAPDRSSSRLVLYAVIFVCLAAVSLYIRGSRSHSPTVSAGSPTAAANPFGPSPGSIPSDNAIVLRACRSATPAGGYRLDAAFQDTELVVSSWFESLSDGQQPSPVANLPATTEIAVCYIDGAWSVPPTVQQAFAAQGLTADRAIVFVPAGGQPLNGIIAPHQELPIVRPFLATPVPSPPAGAGSTTVTATTP